MRVFDSRIAPWEGGMGWYQDEETTGLPDWAVQPLMWLGVLLVAVLPTGVALTLVKLVWVSPPPVVTLMLYGASLGLMVTAVRPWTVR
jgi:hypothetical protein